MFHTFTQWLDKKLNFPIASAHCDIPCKIYDPISAQISVLTMIRMVDLIEALEYAADVNYFNTLSRLVAEKEAHGVKVKEEIRIIWGDYIKQPQLQAFPELHELTHELMLKASYCKQQVDKTATLQLLEQVNRFAEIFWATKNVPTYRAICPYPPAQELIYPKLG